MSSEHQNNPDTGTSRKASAFSDEPLVPEEELQNWDQALVEVIPETQALDALLETPEIESYNSVTKDSEAATHQATDTPSDSQDLHSEAPSPKLVDETETAADPIDQTLTNQNTAGFYPPDTAPASEITRQEDLDTADNAISDQGNDSNPEESESAFDAADGIHNKEEDAEDQVLNQDMLDSLIAAAANDVTDETNEQAQEAPQESDAVLSQDMLDSLIAEAANDVPEESKEQEVLAEHLDHVVDELDQSFIDQLISQQTSEDHTLVEEPTAPEQDGQESSTTETEKADALPADANPMPSSSIMDDDLELDQSNIDNILAAFRGDEGSVKEVEGEKEQATLSGETDKEPNGDELIPQDLLDEILSQKSTETSKITAENNAAEASSEIAAGLLSQNDLDALLEQARTQDKERYRERQHSMEAALAKASQPTPEISPPVKLKKSLDLRAWLPSETGRWVASIAVGLLTAGMMFGYLNKNQDYTPSWAQVSQESVTSLESAMRRATTALQNEAYQLAFDIISPAIEQAPPSPLRNDAAFLELETIIFGMGRSQGLPGYEATHARIDRLVSRIPDHPRIPEVLYWKAKLYESDSMPLAALDTYKQLIDYYPEAPGLDAILHDAATLSIELNNPLTAARFARTLLQHFPASTWSGETRLLLGDAYALAGSPEDARTLFVRTAQAEPFTDLGAEAFLRLGKLSFEQQRYQEAIQHLESRLAVATNTRNTDEAYLMLAQAHRRIGNLEEARTNLNYLMNFFPDSSHISTAYIELSRVLDAMGARQDAIRIAQQASQRFPASPLIQRNLGELYGLSGNALGAANAYVAADASGAQDPALLLNAARYYRAAGLTDDAFSTYRNLKQQYPSSIHALSGSVEEAKLLYDTGRIESAVNQLEELAIATEGSTNRLEVVEALSGMYLDLGIHGRAVELARDIATLTDSPDTLVKAAEILLESGLIDEGLSIANQLQASQLSNAQRYQLKNTVGQALLNSEPERAMESFEEAYLTYPEARTQVGNLLLLRSYLGADRTAAARRMVMETAAHVQSNPVDMPYLIDAATAWGDHLYSRGDFRAAADAFEMVLDAVDRTDGTVTGTQTDPRWAQFQYACALIELDEFNRSLPILEEIADSDAPWANEAAVKADYTRIQMRLRGTPITTANAAG